MKTCKRYIKSPRKINRSGILLRLIVIVSLVLLLGTVLFGCTTEPAQSTEDATTAKNSETNEPGGFVVPTMPAEIPDYLEIDPDTGLHMTGTPTLVDFDSYRLKVSGKVDKTLNLTYDELLLMPKMTATPTIVCPGFFEDTFTWSGVSLKAILDMAGIQDGATYVVMKSADGYSSTLNIENALAPENFLAYEFEGRTLPVLAGFPLRAVLPGESGSRWAKWILEIVVE